MRKFTCENTADAVKRAVYSIMEEVVDGESLYIRSSWGKKIDDALELRKTIGVLEDVLFYFDAISIKNGTMKMVNIYGKLSSSSKDKVSAVLWHSEGVW